VIKSVGHILTLITRACQPTRGGLDTIY